MFVVGIVSDHPGEDGRVPANRSDYFLDARIVLREKVASLLAFVNMQCFFFEFAMHFQRCLKFVKVPH